MRRTLPALLLALPALLPAQVHLAVLGGFTTSGAHATADDDPARPAFRPATGFGLGATLGIDRGAWRAAVTYDRPPGDLHLSGDDGGVITPGAFTANAFGIEIGRRLAGSRGAPTVHLALGATTTRYTFPLLDEPARTRWGVRAALEAGVPISGAFQGVVRAAVARGGSLFTDDELPEGFVRESANGGQLAIGIRWVAR